MTIDGGFVPTPARFTRTVAVEGEALVLDTERDRLHLLSPTAALVWACFDGSGALDDIVTDLAEATAAPHNVVASDVFELTRRLAREGLLDGVEPERDLESAAEVFTAADRPDRDPRFVHEPGST